jgi:phosphoribosylanthranilate isomerase
MNRLKLKICGMKQADNIQQVAGLRPDYLGFIFYPQSPRFVGTDFLVPVIDAAIRKVSVFVNESEAKMDELSRRILAKRVQLHGDESPAICANMKERGYEVIKAFSIDDQFNFSSLTPYDKVVDYFLFDTKGKHRGGNGAAFDWDILKNYHQRIPFFLSGGLSKHNLSQLGLLSSMNLHALDLNSGVETSPGVKDTELIKEIQEFL